MKFREYFKRTWKNKLLSVALLIFGYISTIIDNDSTALIVIMLFAIPLFFAKEDIFNV